MAWPWKVLHKNVCWACKNSWNLPIITKLLLVVQDKNLWATRVWYIASAPESKCQKYLRVSSSIFEEDRVSKLHVQFVTTVKYISLLWWVFVALKVNLWSSTQNVLYSIIYNWMFISKYINQFDDYFITVVWAPVETQLRVGGTSPASTHNVCWWNVGFWCL